MAFCQKDHEVDHQGPKNTLDVSIAVRSAEEDAGSVLICSVQIALTALGSQNCVQIASWHLKRRRRHNRMLVNPLRQRIHNRNFNLHQDLRAWLLTIQLVSRLLILCKTQTESVFHHLLTAPPARTPKVSLDFPLVKLMQPRLRDRSRSNPVEFLQISSTSLKT